MKRILFSAVTLALVALVQWLAGCDLRYLWQVMYGPPMVMYGPPPM